MLGMIPAECPKLALSGYHARVYRLSGHHVDQLKPDADLVRQSRLLGDAVFPVQDGGLEQILHRSGAGGDKVIAKKEILNLQLSARVFSSDPDPETSLSGHTDIFGVTEPNALGDRG